jgi:hypothetical protein
MTRNLPRHLFGLQLAGFSVLVIIIWLDELVDLPFRFLGAPMAPPSWQEALLESGIVIVLAALTLAATRRAMRRVVYLESFVVLCAWCRRVRLDDKWMSVEAYLAVHQAETSHGVCEDCGRRVLAEQHGPAGSP